MLKAIEIRQRGNAWAVVERDSPRVLSTHRTAGEAEIAGRQRAQAARRDFLLTDHRGRIRTKLSA